MYNHEPAGYNCPFCRIVKEAGALPPELAASDVINQSGLVTAFLALGRWTHNPVDVLVVPNAHFENLYDLPVELAGPLLSLTRAVAVALKQVYQCDGVSTRQHNEPSGDQEVWHYHVHITPRFARDDFYRSSKVNFPETDRLEHAGRLRAKLSVEEI